MTIEEMMLIKLNKIAREKGHKLTYTHKMFYIRLVKFAKENGEERDDCYVVEKTERELSEILDISPRMVSQSFKVLSECNVINRIKGERSFPRKNSKTIIYKLELDD